MSRRRHLPPGRVSADPNGGRHAETRHPIEHAASNLCVGPLFGQSADLKSSANDGFVSIRRSLGQASAVVARTTLPANASVLFERCSATLVGLLLTATGQAIPTSLATAWHLATRQHGSMITRTGKDVLWTKIASREPVTNSSAVPSCCDGYCTTYPTSQCCCSRWWASTCCRR